MQEVEIAAKAGFQGFEPWLRELEEVYVQEGGGLETWSEADRRSRSGASRAAVSVSRSGSSTMIRSGGKGMEQARIDMDRVAQIGGKRVAAPPAGATSRTESRPAHRGRPAASSPASSTSACRFGVVPQVEVWGFSSDIEPSRGSVAGGPLESGHASACVLKADVYHLYKGGSGFQTLRLASGRNVSESAPFQ